MITYDLVLEKQRLIGADRFSFAANANETLCLRFNFDRHWRRFDSKAVVFRNSDLQYYIIEIIANRANVPWEVLTKCGEVDLSVIGFDDTKIITSDKVTVTVTESLLPEEYKTFSPSEVLFDRFKRECIQQAYLDYEDEIKALQRTHEKEKLILGEEIVKAKQETQDAIAQKDQELNEFLDKYAFVVSGLNTRIEELRTTLAEVQPKADNWDMVDNAVSMAKLASQTLWGCGTSPYSLPMMNTSSVTGFANGVFSANLREVGLDLTSVNSFSNVFSSRYGIEKLTLRNTHNVTTFASAFENCSTIKEVYLGDLDSCTTIKQMFFGASLLEKLKFTNMVRVQSFERAFCYCVALKEIDGEFNFITASDMTSMFLDCYSLETIRIREKSIRKEIKFSSCINLTKQSLLSIANGLSDEVHDTLLLSIHAFDNAFPTQEEQEEFLDFVTETKGWVLSLG